MRTNSQLINKMIEFRRHIHRFPELSFHEVRTAQYIKSIFKSEGIKVLDFGTHESFISIVEGAQDGKTFGLRAELDALPIREETGLEFSSTNENVMHACGHDMHMAIAMGVTLTLFSQRENLKGRFIAIFQSGEELLPGGAQAITQTNLFNELKPDAMFGIHMLPELEAGKIGLCAGRYMASGDEIYITVKGKGGHAALPHLLVDPVVCSSEIILNLQTIVSRKSPALIPTVLSFGKILANGATNIIPDEVHIEGTFRTMDEEWRGKAHQLIHQTAGNVAKAHGAICEVDIRKGYPSVYNNPELTHQVETIAARVIGSNNVVKLEPRMTTDDFAYFSNMVPSVYFRVGAGYSKKENPQLHQNTFNPSEEAIEIGWDILVNIFTEMMR
ncbi:M20 metallopeptidase family protein [Tenuifilum thalassicum]|uniref:Amidohydrolase n=1 Tax=Tenuifilum thalassicum TaxID=2590900 RepID=A0A7D3XEH6_9BACT|nr:M20 family metallopeptidase [Tenuifilum thalassicum]QKG78877.1 amidohydrolase [Tenuifilum thalassicum]